MNPGGIQLLLVEDNPGDSRLVREMLREVSDITVAGVDSLAAAEGHLASREVDVALLDLGLPDSQGLDTLARVRARYPALPVIVFTGLDDEDVALKAVKAGAQDYLVKGRFDEYLLTRAIRYAVERHRAEVALHESEDRYRTLFNEMPVGVYRTGEDGRIQDANPALAVLFGYASPDEMVGLNVRDFYADPEEQLRWREAVKREGVLHDAEIRVRRKDGTLICALDSGRIVRDQPGLLTYFEGTLSDVTERKRAEGQLRYQATLLASVNDAIVASDARFRLTSWNPAAEAMYGWREEEVLGKDGLEIVRTEWPDVEAMEMRRTIAETGHWRGEATQQRKDGTRFPVEVNSRVLRDESGQITDYISANRDITERKQAELALRESEARFRAVILTANDAIIIADGAGNVVAWNPGAERIFGYTEIEVRGQPLTLLMPDHHHGGHLAGVSRLRTDAEPRFLGRVMEAEGRRKDGSDFPLELSLSDWQIGDEKFYTATVRDITDRKQAEDRIQRQVEALGVLYDLSRTLSAMDDFDAILDLLTRSAAESAHVTFACVLLLEQDDLVLRAAFPVRLLDQDLKVGQREPLAANPLFQRLLEENAPRVLQSDSLEGGECTPFYLGDLQTLCIVPLHVRERPFGLLMLCETRNEAREPFTAEKLRLASSIGDQAVSALQRALLNDETARQLGRLEALHQIDQAIAGSIDMRLTLSVVLEQVTSQLNVDAASALLLDPHSHTLDFVAARGFRTGIPNDIHLRLGEGYAGRAALERKLIHVPDLRHRGTDILRSPFVSAEGFVSYHCVPLIAKGQVKGVLEVFHRAWRDDDAAWESFLETLAGQAAIAIDNSQLFENLQRSSVGLMLAYDATIEGWSRALDMRDKETEGHTQRVTEMTLHMARLTGLSEEELVHVRRGALLHDMGKLGVPDNILLKPGELTEAEWVLMRKHPTFAYEMLSPITYLHPALDIPYCHHEKWDGSGYPRGLKAEQIPKAARIFALVDVFDALRSDRPYRPAWPLDKTLAHIRSLSGSHFDPDLVEPFLAEVMAG